MAEPGFDSKLINSINGERAGRIPGKCDWLMHDKSIVCIHDIDLHKRATGKNDFSHSGDEVSAPQ